jgi:hypothetical protein
LRPVPPIIPISACMEPYFERLAYKNSDEKPRLQNGRKRRLNLCC